MADDRLRKLEHRWLESGTVEDETAYLVERLRAGHVQRGALELAAYCHHEAARRALDGPEPEVFESLRDWAEGVTKWGRTPEMILTFACAQSVLGHAAAADVDPAVREAGCKLGEAAIATAIEMAMEPSQEKFDRCVEASAAVAFAWQGTPLYDHHPFVLEAAGQEALGRSNRMTGRYFTMSAYRLELILGREVAFEILSKTLIGYALAREPTSPPPPMDTSGISPNGAKRIYRILSRLAACDGRLDPTERQVLDRVCELFEIPGEEARVLEREGIEGASLKIGSNPAEQACLMTLMLDVAAADGRLDPNELRRLELVARTVGMPEAELTRRLRERFPD
jgi:uncharacterized tellurite resistance protein B-like protein